MLNMQNVGIRVSLPPSLRKVLENNQNFIVRAINVMARDEGDIIFEFRGDVRNTELSDLAESKLFTDLVDAIDRETSYEVVSTKEDFTQDGDIAIHGS